MFKNMTDYEADACRRFLNHCWKGWKEKKTDPTIQAIVSAYSAGFQAGLTQDWKQRLQKAQKAA